MDANDPSQSPHGANFLPQLPPVSVEPHGIDPFPDHLEEEFNTYLLTNNNRKLLTSRRRWEMREILNYPNTDVDSEVHRMDFSFISLILIGL
jgi:hypothetical protein